MVMSASRWAPRPHPRVAGFPWNQWQLSPGIGGSFAMESVATFVWNRWQLCRGISGRIALESVATLAWNTHPLSTVQQQYLLALGIPATYFTVPQRR